MNGETLHPAMELEAKKTKVERLKRWVAEWAESAKSETEEVN